MHADFCCNCNAEFKNNKKDVFHAHACVYYSTPASFMGLPIKVLLVC